MKKWLKWLKIVSVTAVLAGLAGCSNPPKGGDDVKVTTDMPVVFIKSVGATTITVESDYTTGNYGVIASNKYYSKKSIASDAGAGFADGNFYIMQRWLPDNLMLLSENGEFVDDEPIEIAGFNAYGICGNGNGKIYVGSYNASIAVFEKDGDVIAYKNSINLPQYSDAKLSDLKFANGKIYAALQYLDLNDMMMAPIANSKVLEISEAGEVLRVFESNFMNVMQIEIRGNNLFVVDLGNYSSVDGGVTVINLTDGTGATVLSGADEAADPDKIEFISDNEGYLKLYKDWGDEYVVKFSLSGSKMNLSSGKFSEVNPAKAISYNQSTKTLWVSSGNEVFKY